MDIQALNKVCYCANLRSMARRVTMYFNKVFKSHKLGITATQFTYLADIKSNAGTSTGAMVERMGAEITTLSRNLTLLEGKGLVSIRISKHCGRTNDIVLTADGENTLAKGMAAWEEAQDSFREFLGEKRSNILFDLSQAVNACVLAL